MVDLYFLSDWVSLRSILIRSINSLSTHRLQLSISCLSQAITSFSIVKSMEIPYLFEWVFSKPSRSENGRVLSAI